MLIGELAYPPEVTESGVLFSDSTSKIIEHAVAMKRYNGLGNSLIEAVHDYCYWDGTNQRWVITNYAKYYDSNNNIKVNYYVKDVCAKYP